MESLEFNKSNKSKCKCKWDIIAIDVKEYDVTSSYYVFLSVTNKFCVF